MTWQKEVSKLKPEINQTKKLGWISNEEIQPGA
jgi:hypothetical protein